METSSMLSFSLSSSSIELRMLNYRLKILSIKKKRIHKFMYPLVKLAFTNKTKCKFFSFIETNEDYSIVLDTEGFDELKPYLDLSVSNPNNNNENNQDESIDDDEKEFTLSQSDWIPMHICGEHLPGNMSISKIANFLILPLANWKISIMAISMYQCDYILVQEQDYEQVLCCLANHIPKIFDESVSIENELVLNRSINPEIKSTQLNKAIDLTQKRKSKHKDKHKHKIKLPLYIPDMNEYCIAGLYNYDSLYSIIPSLIEIMFFETDGYKNNEIFFNLTKKEDDVSIVMETRLLKKFPSGVLFNIESNIWKMVRIGQRPVGFEVFGVCASVSQPLELANIDEFYISSFHTGYCFIPSEALNLAKEYFVKSKAKFVENRMELETQSDKPTYNTSNDNNQKSNSTEEDETDDNEEEAGAYSSNDSTSSTKSRNSTNSNNTNSDQNIKSEENDEDREYETAVSASEIEEQVSEISDIVKVNKMNISDAPTSQIMNIIEHQVQPI